jgi:transposase
MWIKENVVIKKGKTYTSALVVESVREGKKIKHKTLLNISKWDKEKRESFKAFLKGKQITTIEQLNLTAGKSIGGILILKKIAEELRIIEAIGTRNKELPKILLLIIGRILTQGSRLHLLNWGKTQELEKTIGIEIEKIKEDDLYETLDYLAKTQEKIEKKLFKLRCEKQGKTPRIYLYDVTSSYLEGDQNELATYGYNRDKKQGKKQIVIGLLTDDEGYPLAIRVFEGNTLDPKTVHAQIEKIAKSFGVSEIIMIGDKGMLKKAQIEELTAQKYHYITSITKPQIKTLIKQETLQLSLFDEKIGEVTVEEKGEDDKAKTVRYVYRRNPIRAQEMQESREQKKEWIEKQRAKTNISLKEHPKATVQIAQKNLEDLIKQRHCPWMSVQEKDRVFSLHIDQEKLAVASELDGCFVLKTDCLVTDLPMQTIHDRYKDLKHVEFAFRTIKTGFLEVRPIFVRKDTRTRGHVFVTMLAYMLIHHFQRKTKSLPATLVEKVDAIDKIQTVNFQFLGESLSRIPKQSAFINDLLQLLGYSLPEAV